MPQQTSAILRKASFLNGTSLNAVDGEVGTVVDLLFDDQSLLVRYLVIDTGGWIGGRQFLFSPEALEHNIWDGQSIEVDLKKEVFEDSPDIDLQRPVSRQALDELHQYFSWPIWQPWQISTLAHAAYVPITPATGYESSEGASLDQGDDPHLRSTGEVMGYAIQGREEELGILEDFFVGVSDWKLEYLTVNTRSWLPGRKVLISTDHIRHIDFARQEVSIDLDRDDIEACPEYDHRADGGKPFTMAQYRYLGFDPYLIRFTS